jgi:zinc protease
MRTYRLLLAVVVLGIAACATAKLYTLVLKPYELEGASYPMPSGMQVFFQEDHGQPSVLVTSVVDVGSTSDPVGKEGLAHVMEHLWFRADSDQKMSVMDRLKTLGGTFNAFTTHDSTTFHTVAPKDTLETLLTLEARRLMTPLAGVTEEVVTTEREVIRNELRLRGETKVDDRIFDAISANLFPAPHPYHRPVIGTHESLDAIKLADVQAFAAEHYKPQNVTLVVAGDFNKADTRALMSRTLPQVLVGDAKAPVAPQRRYAGASAPPPPAPSTTAIQHIQGPVQRTRVFLGWSLPAAYGDDDAVMEAVTETMVPAVSSLLVPEGVYDRDKVGDLGCGVEPGLVNSTAYCFFETLADDDPDDLAKKAVDGLWEMWDLNTRTWREQDLARGKTAVMAYLFADSASLWRGLSVADSLHNTGHPDLFSRRLSQFGKVSEPRVRRFAHEYLTRARAVALVVTPENAHAPGRPVVAERGSDHGAAAFGEKRGMDETFAKITDADIEATAIAPDLSQARELTLANGMRVVIKRHGAAPFVSIALFSRGGRYDSQPFDLVRFAGDVHDARDPLQVAGLWRTQYLQDGQLLIVSVPSGNLAAGVDLLASRAETTETRYERIFYERSLRLAEGTQEAQRHDPDFVLQRELRARIYKDHPLGKVEDDLAALKAVGKGDFADWYRRTLAPANSTLLVVGDLALDEAERLVRERWSAWRVADMGALIGPLPALPPPPSREILLLDRPHTVQTSIHIACPLPGPTIEQRASSRVGVELLDENLWRVVRERLGATYGLQVWPETFRREAALLHIQGDIQSDKVGLSLATMLDELKTIAAGGASAARLKETKWGIAGRTHTDNLTTEDMLMTLVGLEQINAPLAPLVQFPHEVAVVDAAALARQLALCPGHEIIGLIGPAAVLKPSLAGLGPVTDVAWTSVAEK